MIALTDVLVAQTWAAMGSGFAVLSVLAVVIWATRWSK